VNFPRGRASGISPTLAGVPNTGETTLALLRFQCQRVCGLRGQISNTWKASKELVVVFDEILKLIVVSWDRDADGSVAGRLSIGYAETSGLHHVY